MRKITKILFFSIVVSLVLVYFNPNWIPAWVPASIKGQDYQNQVSLLKSKFQQAIQDKNLGDAKAQYLALKNLLPWDDHFVNEIATAYMADLYIEYAHQMAFNPKAAAALLDQAQALAPNHPALKTAQAEIVQVQARLATMDLKTTQIQDSLVKAQDLIEQSVVEAKAIKENLLEEQKTQVQDALALAALEAAAEGASMTTQDRALAPPAETPLAPEAIMAQIPMPDLRDPCSLAYYTRKTSLVSCMDTVDDHRFGPALFVVGEEKHPLLAFSQQPVSRHDYNTFCAVTHECYDDVDELAAVTTQLKASGVALDVRDVEQTVSDYNAYCQMNNTCKPIKSQAQKNKELTKGQLQRYALWLSKVTGYRYRVTSETDVNEIVSYIDHCVQYDGCQPALLDQAKRALVYRDKYLTRVTEHVASNGP